MTVELNNSIAIVCPICKAPLTRINDAIICKACNRKFTQPSDKFTSLVPEDKLQDLDFKSWETRQNIFLGWYHRIMDEAIVTKDKNLYDEFAGFIGNIKGLTLDIGCADGQMNSYLKETQYIGIDPYEGWIINERPSYVDKMFPIDRGNLIFIKGLGEFLPFNDKSIDNVIISNALDHSISPYKMLEEGQRVLKPGGMLLIMHENPSLLKKIRSKGFFGLIAIIRRRIMQKIFVGSIHSPHIKIDKTMLEKWLNQSFKVVTKPSKKGTHIFYKALK